MVLRKVAKCVCFISSLGPIADISVNDSEYLIG